MEDKQKKKPSEKQLEALKKGREIRLEKIKKLKPKFTIKSGDFIINFN